MCLYFWVFLHERYMSKSASEETGLVVGVPGSEEVKIVWVSRYPCDFLSVTYWSGKMPSARAYSLVDTCQRPTSTD